MPPVPFTEAAAHSTPSLRWLPVLAGFAALLAVLAGAVYESRPAPTARPAMDMSHMSPEEMQSHAAP